VLWRVLRIGLPSWFEGLLLWAGQFLIVVLVIKPQRCGGGAAFI